MQLVLFAMIFAMCTMILKTESSHTFEELGFNFKNQNVHDYLKQEAPELRKICQQTSQSYVWKLPIANGKAFKFTEVVRNGATTTWGLIHINEKRNFNPFLFYTAISFQVKNHEKKIYLTNLYPTFPKVSGVDILQFLMALSYVCEFTLHLNDKSDISSSYRLLYGIGYYENLIKGIGIKQINQDKLIFKKDFDKCAKHELRNLDLLVLGIEDTINSCRDEGISVHDCPVHFIWLGRVIHCTLIPKCGVNNYSTDFPHPELKFLILPKDLTQIFNKISPKSQQVLYPIVKDCTPKVKAFETVERSVRSLKFFENAFDFCFPNPIFTASNMFKI